MAEYTHLLSKRKPVAKYTASELEKEPKLIKEVLDDWKNRKLYKEALIGLAYYNGENTLIKNRKAMATYKGKDWIRTAKDALADNHKVINPAFRDVVDQPTDYTVGNEFGIDLKGEDTLADQTVLQTMFSKNKHHSMTKAQVAQYQIKGYAGVRIGEDGKNLKLTAYPAEQFAFFYQDLFSVELDYVLAFRKEYKWVNDKGTKKKALVEVVELITPASTMHYIMSGKDVKPLTIRQEPKKNPAGVPMFENGEPLMENLNWQWNRLQHKVNMETNVIESTIRAEKQWDTVPFVVLSGNELRSKITSIKAIIDSLDINTSDMQNELIRLQRLIYIVKGYANTDASKFLEDVNNGVVMLDDDEKASVDVKNANANVDSRIKNDELLNKKIFRYAKIIDLEKLDNISNVTGVALKALYEPLNQASRSIQSDVTDYYRNISYFQFFKDDKDNAETLAEDLTLEFDIRMLANEQEDISNFLLLKGQIPELDRYKMLPIYKGLTDEEVIEKIAKTGADPTETLDPTEPLPPETEEE